MQLMQFRHFKWLGAGTAFDNSPGEFGLQAVNSVTGGACDFNHDYFQPAAT